MLCENLVKGREKTKKHIPNFSRPLNTLSVHFWGPIHVPLFGPTHCEAGSVAVCLFVCVCVRLSKSLRQTWEALRWAAQNVKPSTWKIMWRTGNICQPTNKHRKSAVSPKGNLPAVLSVLHISSRLCCSIICLLFLVLQTTATWRRMMFVLYTDRPMTTNTTLPLSKENQLIH